MTEDIKKTAEAYETVSEEKVMKESKDAEVVSEKMIEKEKIKEEEIQEKVDAKVTKEFGKKEEEQKNKGKPQRRGRRNEVSREELLAAWVPKTKLGKDVKDGKIKNIDEILEKNQKILEPEIVDTLVNIQSDLIFCYFVIIILSENLSRGSQTKVPVENFSYYWQNNHL